MLFANLKWGLKWGLTIALIYTALASFALVLFGEEPFVQHGTSFPGLIGFYALGGCVGGATLGLLRPLARTKVGTVVMGMCVGFSVWLGFLAEVKGLRNLNPFDFFSLAAATLIAGPVGASFFLRGKESERSSPGEGEGEKSSKR